MVLRVETQNSKVVGAKKRKREVQPLVESNNIKPAIGSPSPKKIKNKAVKSAPPVLQNNLNAKPCLNHVVNIKGNKSDKVGISEDVSVRYPILGDKDLVVKFLSVPMTNNQKGRIRQLLKDSLKGTSEFLLPDVIHTRIQSIIKATDVLSETELRKIRILYNMLKTALATAKSGVDTVKKKNKKSTNKKVEDKEKQIEMDGVKRSENIKKEVKTEQNIKKEVKTEQNIKREVKTEQNIKKEVKTEQGDIKKTSKTGDTKKVKSSEKPKDKEVNPKGPKRYVVFLGNLPPDINKEKIMQHFSEFNECIVNIRIPKRPEGKKSSIAYVELKNEPTYELALSKHHSMLGNKRINVLYTTQKNGKVSRSEAKSKSAKLIALQKAGKLIGSVPLNRKRSQRRLKMKRAQAKLAAESA